MFSQLKVTTYDDFYHNNQNEGLVAGTIMSVQEKKAQKELLMVL